MAQHRIHREAAERVIRRAVELSDEPGDTDDLEVAALAAAAADLGIQPGDLRRAVAEEEAGLLDRHRSTLDRLVGPEATTVARAVPLPAGEAMRLADEWLRRVWAFRRVRSSVGVAEYRRRGDVIAGLQRSFRSLTGVESAARVESLRVMARPIDDSQSLLALVVDLGSSRTMAEVGGLTLGASGMIVSVASALAWAPWAWLGVPASAAAGVSVMAMRRHWAEGVDPELEGMLDRMASGLRPAPLVDLAARGARPRSRPHGAAG